LDFRGKITCFSHFQQQFFRFLMNHHNSTEVYSRPSTPEQVKFYTSHGHKFRLYGRGMVAVQLILAAFSAVAAFNILMDIIPAFEYKEWACYALSILALVFLHPIFRAEALSWFFANLDNDPETNRSAVVTVILAAAIIFLDYKGMSHVGVKHFVKPQETADRMVISSGESSELANAKLDYDASVKLIEDNKAAALAAVTDKESAALAQWDAKPNKSASDNAWIATQTAAVRKKHANLRSTTIAEYSPKLEAALAAYNEEKTRINGKYSKEVARVDVKDTSEKKRFEDESAMASTYAGFGSAILTGLFLLFAYQKVNLMVKSGILPLRDFNVLNQHGTFFEKLWRYVVIDSMNRAGHAATTWLHQRLAIRELRDFDMNIIEVGSTPAALAGGGTGGHGGDDGGILARTSPTPTKPVPSGTPAPAPSTAPSTPSTPTGPSAPMPTAPSNVTAKAKADVIILPHEVEILWEKFVALHRFYTSQKHHNTATWTELQLTRFDMYHLGYCAIFRDPEYLLSTRTEGELFPEFMAAYPIEQKPEKVAPPIPKPTHIPAPPKTADTMCTQVYTGETEEAETEGDPSWRQFDAVRDQSGNLIGIRYKKVNGKWQVLGETQVRSKYNTYKSRAVNEVSDAVQMGMETWKMQLDRFEAERKKKA
jgi:hypothetical protein